jgi:predicted nucleic acid-binding protein
MPHGTPGHRAASPSRPFGTSHRGVSFGWRPAEAQAVSPHHARYHDLLEQVALIVEPAQHSFGLQDPDDEIYLATAFAGQAEALVTGNIRHFPTPRYGSIEILRPAEFLTRHGG